jgi:hypothetical protein
MHRMGLATKWQPLDRRAAGFVAEDLPGLRTA